MVKKLYLVFSLLTVFFVTTPQAITRVQAVGYYGEAVSNNDIPYFNDDANYPMVYVYHGYREYLDLSSCTFVSNTKDSYEFAACYVNTNVQFLPETVQKTDTIYFRQKKDGKSLPQYYDDKTQKWITIPAYYYNEVEKLSYSAYIGRWHPYQYFAFKMIYKQLFEVEYADNMNGHTF